MILARAHTCVYARASFSRVFVFFFYLDKECNIPISRNYISDINYRISYILYWINELFLQHISITITIITTTIIIIMRGYLLSLLRFIFYEKSAPRHAQMHVRLFEIRINKIKVSHNEALSFWGHLATPLAILLFWIFLMRST